MRIVLADLRGREGFVSKDTVAGGYGSRLRPFSKTTELVSLVKRRTHDVPSVQLAYLAAIAARHGHEVHWTRDEYADGDVAIPGHRHAGRHPEVDDVAAELGIDHGAEEPLELLDRRRHHRPGHDRILPVAAV